MYGRPEEYHRKRQNYERADRSRSPDDRRTQSSSPRRHQDVDHEEYYYYRRSNKAAGYEEEYDYYRGPRKKPVHERLTLPNKTPPSRSAYHSSDEDVGVDDFEEKRRPRKGRKRSYENFKVTIRNESDGTPSLSGTQCVNLRNFLSFDF